jgi:hypothetical protein
MNILGGTTTSKVVGLARAWLLAIVVAGLMLAVGAKVNGGQLLYKGAWLLAKQSMVPAIGSLGVAIGSLYIATGSIGMVGVVSMLQLASLALRSMKGELAADCGNGCWLLLGAWPLACVSIATGCCALATLATVSTAVGCWEDGNRLV